MKAASLTVREYFRLFHLPTTSCILAFAVIGSAWAPTVDLNRLLLVLLQLLLVGAVASNYFDEIRGRPWHTQIPATRLWIIGFSALAASSLIGVYLMLTAALWFWPFILAWGFFAVAYDLELFKGRFHNTSTLAVSWGSICLGSYYIQSLTITPQILVLSFIVGYIAGYGRDLYEVAKPVCKDKNPSPHSASRFSWKLLKASILFVDIYAATLLTHRLLA